MRKTIMLTATWCAPCRRAKRDMIPMIETACPGQVEVVDVEDDPDNLAKKNKVTRVPSMVLMEDGKAVQVYDGMLPQPEAVITWLKGGELHGADRCEG